MILSQFIYSTTTFQPNTLLYHIIDSKYDMSTGQSLAMSSSEPEKNPLSHHLNVESTTLPRELRIIVFALVASAAGVESTHLNESHFVKFSLYLFFLFFFLWNEAGYGDRMKMLCEWAYFEGPISGLEDVDSI